MAGGGKGGGGSGTSQVLEDISKQLFEETTPLRGEYIGQLLEGLVTGGIGARIPLVQQSVERSKLASARTMRQQDESLAMSSLLGTPFGESIRAQSRQQAAQQQAAIPGQMTQQFMQALPSFLTGQGQTVVTGLGTAGQVANQAQANAMAPWLSLMDMFSFGF